MSMNAIFVQVEDAEIARYEKDPDSVETLFSSQALPTAGLLNMAAAAQDRIRAAGPQQVAAWLSRLPEPIRQQVEASLGRTTAALAAGEGGDDLVKLLQNRLAQRSQPEGKKRDQLSLEKAWHGVHYLLAGTVEPGTELRSQAVLGGTELGDDPEGFSGYGPARYFRAAQVRELSEELRRPEVESEAAARYDPAKMERLHIYPGWSDEEDQEWVMDAFRRLRDFYASAASNGHGIVTCLV